MEIEFGERGVIITTTSHGEMGRKRLQMLESEMKKECSSTISVDRMVYHHN